MMLGMDFGHLAEHPATAKGRGQEAYLERELVRCRHSVTGVQSRFIEINVDNEVQRPIY